MRISCGRNVGTSRRDAEFTEGPRRSLASRAGGRRAAAAARAAAGAVGGPAHAELREAFLRLPGPAGGADHVRVRSVDQLLEAALAVLALIFVDRHGNAYRNHR